MRASKRYDRQTASYVCNYPGSRAEETLYRNARGEFFLLIQKCAGPPRRGVLKVISSETIKPLSRMEAVQWLIQTQIPEELQPSMRFRELPNGCGLFATAWWETPGSDADMPTGALAWLSRNYFPGWLAEQAGKEAV